MMLFFGNIHGLSAFRKAFINTKREMMLSILVLCVFTFVLSFVFFLVEHIAQPDVFDSYWSCLAWANTRYIEGGDGVFEGGPITIVGRIIAFLLGLVGIAIVAIPAGLIGSGFMDAIAEEKRLHELEAIRSRLKKAFRPRQCRYTKERTEPRYVSVVDIEAKQHIDQKDIMDAVNDGANYRLRNLATTQNASEHPQDRLVVEHFPVTEGVPYGCKIDRQSNITIVGTSNVHEAGIGNFAYYVAELGGFNYVSKEVEVDEDNPVSFYVVENPDDEASNSKRFIDDVKSLSRGKDKWVIFFISASGAEEPAYPTHFHFIYGAKKGDEGYTDPNLTICDAQRFDAFYQQLTTQLQSEFGYESDRHRYHTGAGKKNIARRIGGGTDTNAFTLRTAFKVTVWDDRNIAIAKTIAENIKSGLGI